MVKFLYMRDLYIYLFISLCPSSQFSICIYLCSLSTAADIKKKKHQPISIQADVEVIPNVC